jgi:hypothetical protein
MSRRKGLDGQIKMVQRKSLFPGGPGIMGLDILIGHYGI